MRIRTELVPVEAVFGRLLELLPLNAEDGSLREEIEESELISSLTDLDGPESAGIAISLVRRVFLALAVLDKAKLATGKWAFVSFPASLLARSFLAMLSTKDASFLPPDYWLQGTGRPEGLEEEQRALLKRLESERVATSGTNAAPIRTVHVTWGLIRLGTPESTRSLALETGRLVEAFLKWCLHKWFPGPRQLDETESIKQQGLLSFNQYVGQTLGKGSSITLPELLHASGMPLNKHEVHYLIGGNRKPQGVWTSSTGIPSLVVANAMAARSQVNHPFRNLDSEYLIKAMSTFNAAYGIRNKYFAHYVPERDSWVSSSEVLFLSTSVLAFVDQIMSLSAKLIDKRMV